MVSVSLRAPCALQQFTAALSHSTAEQINALGGNDGIHYCFRRSRPGLNPVTPAGYGTGLPSQKKKRKKRPALSPQIKTRFPGAVVEEEKRRARWLGEP